MLVEDQAPPREAPIQDALWRRIDERTWGRVRSLEVEVRDGRVTVRGVAPSYYVKQLALLAVRELLDVTPVDLQIEVVASYRRPAQGHDRAVPCY